MKLYGMQQSRSFRCLWALEESGLQYEYIPIKLRINQEDPSSAKNPAYLAINSQGKVPSLTDGEMILTESVAILNHIGRNAPESGLLPIGDLKMQAKHDELVAFVLAELEQPLWNKGKHTFALPEQYQIPAMLDTAKFEFTKAVSTLDRLLSSTEYAIGERFSIADILLAHTFNWAIRFEFDVPQRYVDLRNQHYERPSAKRALKLVS